MSDQRENIFELVSLIDFRQNVKFSVMFAFFDIFVLFFHLCRRPRGFVPLVEDL